MEKKLKEENPDSPMSGIYEIPGEPALVINGVPPLCTGNDGSLFHCDVVSNIDSKLNEPLGDWLDGREVRKVFGGRVYNGKVSKFDKESGWYRVVYEDGDFEDLEWHELREVLLPLDVTIPLKTLASKVIKKSQKHEKKFGRSVTKPKIHQHKELQSGVEKMEV
ncbi:dirigent protein 17-like [Cynara cardunculus var. scolymus]|nr:dirigent protein 17-like [Cynara cardunculus var. scolymus]